jgi:general secretion pathway protein H
MKPETARGFTLLEMLVVVMIIALMVTLSGVKFGGRGKGDLESIGQTLKADLRHVRSKSLVGSRDTSITFDVNKKTYFSDDASIQRSFPQKIEVNITLDEKNISGSLGKIAFYPDGSSSGGTVTLVRDGRQLELVTSWLNGYVSLQ